MTKKLAKAHETCIILEVKVTYAEINVTIDEDLTAPLAANIGLDLTEFASLGLLLHLQCILSHLISEKTGGVLPPTQDKRSISFLCRDNSLLNLLVDGSFNSAHKASTHVDTLGTKSQGSSKTLAIGKSTRGDERNAEFLTSTAQKDEVGDIVLTDVAGTLKAIDGKEVHAELDGGLCMADCCALVQDNGASLLQLGDDGAWVVTGGLDDLDTFVDDDLGVGGIVGGNDGGKEGQVHSEGVFGHGPTSADFFAEVFGGWLGEGCELDFGVRYYIQLRLSLESIRRTSPSPPALLTAEASSAYPTHCIPPCTTGTICMISRWLYIGNSEFIAHLEYRAFVSRLC